MRQASENVTYLAGSSEIIRNMQTVRSLGIFSKEVMEFLADLSETLLRDHAVRQYPDLVSFAFWLRRQNLAVLKADYDTLIPDRTGRGVVFHITPSNIPVQSAVSLVSGLLAGNANIVRVPDMEFWEITRISQALCYLLDNRYPSLKPYVAVVRYGHDDVVTGYYSGICDARVIWGGNEAVTYIRGIPLPPRAVELCFADRDSVAVIDSDEYLKGDSRRIAKDFYNDTYYTDQNACSSPRIVIWTGSRTKEAKRMFWSALEEYLDGYDLSPAAGSEKLLRFCLLAATDSRVKMEGRDNKLVRVQVPELRKDLLAAYKSSQGYFFEYTAESLDEIVPLLGKSCQSVEVYGIDPQEIKDLVFRHGIRGVDRIVPVGQALGISLCWDGFDMISQLSRVIGHM